jgi:hypothetical protein
MPLNTFSLVENNYTGVFDAAGAKRPSPIPAEVVKIIGGNSTGGAYIRTPQIWSDLYLQYVFNPSLARPSYTPTYTLWQTASTNTPTTFPAPIPLPKPAQTPIGAIVGGTIGGIVFVCIVAIFFVVRHRRSVTARRAADTVDAAQLDNSPYEETKHPGMYRNLPFAPLLIS